MIAGGALSATMLEIRTRRRLEDPAGDPEQTNSWRNWRRDWSLAGPELNLFEDPTTSNTIVPASANELRAWTELSTKQDARHELTKALVKVQHAHLEALVEYQRRANELTSVQDDLEDLLRAHVNTVEDPDALEDLRALCVAASLCQASGAGSAEQIAISEEGSQQAKIHNSFEHRKLLETAEDAALELARFNPTTGTPETQGTQARTSRRVVLQPHPSPLEVTPLRTGETRPVPSQRFRSKWTSPTSSQW